MRAPDNGRDETYEFTRFRVLRAARRLECDGVRIPLGDRAFEVLLCLLENAGEIVPARQLLDAVWPDGQALDGNLRVHVAGLRKALALEDPESRYIVNVTGRGYCFVPPVTYSPRASAEITPSRVTPRLPNQKNRLAGRADAIGSILAQLEAHRFVTVVGPGGIGKTTVAVSVAHALSSRFDGPVLFVDLSTIQDPQLVASTIASMLRLPMSGEPMEAAIMHLRDAPSLLILDSCEHVIETVAVFAERLFQETAQITILCTSREPLRVEGERLYVLSPLAYPIYDAELTPELALAFPAVELFVDRAKALDSQFSLNAENLELVAGICAKLDGIALAIELAASRLEAFDLRQLATLLDSRLKMLWRGRRTAPPRHQTLSTALDWSYRLLSEHEKLVLDRLSVFVGEFTLQAVFAITESAPLSQAEVSEIVTDLAAKSLVVPNITDAQPRYRLLDMTRAYASQQLAQRQDAREVARAHAQHVKDFVVAASEQADHATPLTHQLTDEIPNVRSALEWCFSPDGDFAMGIELAAASPAFFLPTSLWQECRFWCETAIDALNDGQKGSRLEMILQAALGMSLRWSYSEEFRVAFNRSLEIADLLGEVSQQLHLLHHLRVIELRDGHYAKALSTSLQSLAVAQKSGDANEIAIAESTLGIVYQTLGNQRLSRSYCEAALVKAARLQERREHHYDSFIFDQAGFALSNSLWHTGLPDQAEQVATRYLTAARDSKNYLLRAEAVIWCSNVYIWRHEWDVLKSHVDLLALEAKRHPATAVTPFIDVLQAAIDLNIGSREDGMAYLLGRNAVPSSPTLELMSDLVVVPKLLEAGKERTAIELLDKILQDEEVFGRSRWSAEVLRLKALASVATNESPAAAAKLLERARGIAIEQGSLSFQLRIATTAASLPPPFIIERAHDELRAVFSRFSEGHDTPDLIAAARALEAAGQP